MPRSTSGVPMGHNECEEKRTGYREQLSCANVVTNIVHCDMQGCENDCKSWPAWDRSVGVSGIDYTGSHSEHPVYKRRGKAGPLQAWRVQRVPGS